MKTDTGIRSIYYLPTRVPDREIRFIEINELIADRHKNLLEPIDFGVDAGASTAHRLMVLDVTPTQWAQIQTNQLPLPDGWSLDGATSISR